MNCVYCGRDVRIPVSHEAVCEEAPDHVRLVATAMLKVNPPEFFVPAPPVQAAEVPPPEPAAETPKRAPEDRTAPAPSPTPAAEPAGEAGTEKDPWEDF